VVQRGAAALLRNARFPLQDARCREDGFRQGPVLNEALRQLTGLFFRKPAPFQPEPDGLDYVVDEPLTGAQTRKNKGRTRIAALLQRPEQIDGQGEGVLPAPPCQIDAAHQACAVRAGTPSNWISTSADIF
jgi:hypothetical protein